MIFILIPVFNRLHFTMPCLESLMAQDFKDFKVIVIDHGSTDETSNYIKLNYPLVTVLTGNDNMWWTAATNMGVKYALDNGADFILTLNNDLIVGEDFLSNLFFASQKKPHSIIGSASLDIDFRNRVVFAGTKWNPWIARYRPTVPKGLLYSELMNRYTNIESDLLPGRGTLIPAKVFKLIGLFDDVNFPHYMADEDFSARAIKAGYRCYVNTSAAVYSHYKETGLSNTHKKKNPLQYLKESFTSIKSPNNIKIRWYWAKRYGKIPPLYFFLDFGRVFLSQIYKVLKVN